MSTWVTHIPLEGLDLPEDGSYISFGEVTRLAEQGGQFRNLESLTHFLVADLFKGKFESPRTGPVPAIYAADRSRMRTPMLTPQISVDPSLLSEVEPTTFIVFGWSNGSREAVLLALQTLGALSFSLPVSLNEQILQDAYERLSAHAFFHYSEPAQEYLLNINVKKHVLEGWFEARGLIAPWKLSASAPVSENNSSRSGDAIAANDNPATPGRPRNKLWAFIKAQACHIRSEDPDILNKCLAGKVRDIAVAKFPGAKVPALSTIEKKLCRMGASRYGNNDR